MLDVDKLNELRRITRAIEKVAKELARSNEIKLSQMRKEATKQPPPDNSWLDN